MSSGFKKIASACWKPVRQYVRMNRDEETSISDDDNSGENQEPLLWSRELEKHYVGEFSFAVIQANGVVEDYSQVETGRDATFVGVYDGHGGPEAARYISDKLFLHLMTIAREKKTISEDAIRSALSATENGFLTLVSRTCQFKPIIAAIGSCCLVGVIWKGTLCVANVGDSRAVIGSVKQSTNKIVALQMTKEHNASFEEVREELKNMHPDDPTIVVLKHGVWRIKGIIQVSRSIGDAYLKNPELALDLSFPRFHVSEPIRRPVLTAEPSISTRELEPGDQFVIFASDGLWEHLTNQEAVDIVHNSPKTGVAKKLVKRALKKVAKRLNITSEDLRAVEKGERRKYHDDITVVVLFLDHELLNENIVTPVPELSIKGFVDTAGPSQFSILQETN